MINESSRSHFKTQLLALGLEDDGAIKDELVGAEREFVQSQSLRGIPDLSPRRGPGLMRLQYLGGLVALACVLTLVLWQESGADLSAKGSGKAWVYYERDGQVGQWDESISAQALDRFRAEVLASKKSYAYWGVVDGDGKIISGSSAFINSAIEIDEGTRKVFAGSFVLDKSNEHESIYILICQNQGKVDILNSTIKDMLFESESKVAGLRGLGCQEEIVKLR